MWVGGCKIWGCGLLNCRLLDCRLQDCDLQIARLGVTHYCSMGSPAFGLSGFFVLLTAKNLLSRSREMASLGLALRARPSRFALIVESAGGPQTAAIVWVEIDHSKLSFS